MSIAQLKRDAKEKKYLASMKVWMGKEVKQQDLPVRLQGERLLCNANSVGIFFLNADGKESELQLGKAALVEYESGKSLKTYFPGYREPNEQEQAILHEWSGIEDCEEYQHQMEVDCLTDGSSCYWRRRLFFTQKNALYLMGYNQRGMCMDHNRKNAGEKAYIRDENVRGGLMNEYTLRNVV